MTPLDPRDPYIAEAAASFSTSYDSISFGLRFTSGFNPVSAPSPAPTEELPPVVGLVTGIPSTTTNGDVLAVIEDAPRIRIVDEEPSAPVFDVNCTPEILPWIASSAVFRDTSPRSSGLTCPIELVISRRERVPYPVTTTSSSCWVSSPIVMLISLRPSISSVIVSNPTNENSSTSRSSGTVISYRPSTSVDVPVVVP